MNDSTTAFKVPRGSETILVAEDNEALRALLRIGLEICGYHVLAAASGREALRLAALRDGPIALLITGVVMPEIGGPELARRLAARRPGLKVLLLSGPSEEMARLGKDAAILRKPFRPSALVAKVREILDRGPAAEPHGPSPAAICSCVNEA
jgi:two-component system cell cycle sensor histidine kinase/response regulator CckA